MNHLLPVLDNDQGLLMVSNMHAISVSHVLGDADFFVVVLEFFLGGVRGEIDVVDLVDALVTPICDDTRSDDMLSDEIFELLVVTSLFFQFIDLV